MRKISASLTCTVYHDGRFWVGMFERVEGGRLSACRVVFGAEPSNEEVQRFVAERYDRLRFTDPVGCGEVPRAAANPKRRQREAARELRGKGPSTKARQALAEEREALARGRSAEARARREREKRERFEQRQEKRKRKRRGR